MDQVFRSLTALAQRLAPIPLRLRRNLPRPAI
ncbi:hypothetical protein CABS03_13541 [Colletotrichum abscissum]|uniref:Uncharacterized protein n=1 Tax=Colletotrichum abscissum TaxID=1671311 RepID=A0A9P9X8Y5_9PEZI|nr:hypothetical protein CABS02_10187 [Colletotrichum abscissum]